MRTIPRWPATTALALAACSGDPARPRAERPPNVLLVVLDDWGIDGVSAYGDPTAPPTPEIDALAADGVTFRRAWASPVCTPSRASLLTGRHGNRTGLGAKIDPDEAFALPDAEVTIAEALRAAPEPYTTIAVGKWHLAGGADNPLYDAPRRQGFDVFAGSISNLDLHSSRVEDRTNYSRWEQCDEGGCAISERYATSAIVDRALEELEDAAEPWFLYAAFHAAHDPWHAPPAELNPGGVVAGDPVGARYDAMIRAADTELGRLLRGLDPDERERTVVVVAGDNGTPGPVARDPDRAKHSLYEGGVNVPFVVSGARVGARGATSDALVHLVDVLPTVAELAGLDPEALETAGPIDGQSLAPFLADPAAPGRDWLFTTHLGVNGPPPWQGARYAVRDHTFKLIAGTTEQLYRVADGWEDGPDLLAGDTLDAEAEAALATLRARLAEALAWPYDGGL